MVYVLRNKNHLYIDWSGNYTDNFNFARIFTKRNYASMGLKHFRKDTGDDSIYMVPVLAEILENNIE